MTGLIVHEKRCRTCREVKPADKFNRSRREKDGLYSECRACSRDRGRRGVEKRQAAGARECLTCRRMLPASAYYLGASRCKGCTRAKSQLEYVPRVKKHSGVCPLLGKRCSRCGETKPPTAFRVNRRNRDGLESYCATCWSTYRAERHARSAAKIRGYFREYTARHRKAGVCALCAEPTLPRKTLCARHLADKAERARSATMRRIAARRCVRCGDNRSDNHLVHPSQNLCPRHYLMLLSACAFGTDRR